MLRQRSMAKTRKAMLRKSLDTITNIVEDQLAKLPPEVADEKRKRIHQVAVSVSRRARGKP
jgi:hypothetical protein